MRRRWVGVLTGLIVVSLMAVIGVQVLRSSLGPGFLRANGCTVTVDGHTVDLTVEQAENASLIASIAIRRGLPARATSIALATAYQESDLYNLDYGDRDSLGLFQQRPSQGWGSQDQVQDPTYATNRFFDALIRVSDYRSLDITVAAQEVQRSGFPNAYADHEDDARTLASALSGNSRAALSCSIDTDVEEVSADLEESGLTARADIVRGQVEELFGDQTLGGFAPGGVRAGHIPGSAHYDGRAVDIFYRPINEANKTRGWAVAQYLVAHAERLNIATVIFDAQIWTARRSSQGWRDYAAPDRPGDRRILEHRDHVHVDVFS